MDDPNWLVDRRWKWRVVVLVIALIVMGLLVWRGMDPLAAAGATLAIFIVMAVAIGYIIDSPPSAPVKPAPSDPAIGKGLTGSAIEAVVEQANGDQCAGEVTP